MESRRPSVHHSRALHYRRSVRGLSNSPTPLAPPTVREGPFPGGGVLLPAALLPGDPAAALLMPGVPAAATPPRDAFSAIGLSSNCPAAACRF